MARGSPRLLMSLLIAATGGAGFLASWLLLRGGLETMWVRYALSVAAAYLVFLGLLGLWILRHRRRERVSEDPGIDLWPDLAVGPSGGGGAAPPSGQLSGGGGSFGGGGAQASFGPAPSSPSPAGGSGGGGGGIGLDLDDAAVVIAIAAAVLAMAVASVWLVVTAPTLLAELLLDGILVGQLYRRLRRFEGRHWLETALRRTAIPFLATGLVLAVAGFLMQRRVPDARSIGEVWKAIAA
jgi:hypothetical protein